MPMTNEQLKQLEEVLEQRFFPYILERTDSNARGWKPQDHKVNRLSRSLAAFAVGKLIPISDLESCQAVIDGLEDNGIDAIRFDKPSNQLVLVQSKFSQGKEPDLAETLKFIGGIKDLLNKRFDRFNSAFQLKERELLEAFDEPELKIVLALAHLGGELSKHVEPKIYDLLKELNLYKERVMFKNISGDKIYAELTKEYSVPVIDDVLELHNWVISKEKPRILYGQVPVVQLAILFQKHGKHVFAKNIRNYVGSGDVNDAIAKTVRDEPELLMHLNNGLTIVCRNFGPRADAMPEVGRIDIKGLSVVNGAQTVGSIATVASNLDLAKSPARVLVTVIESADAASNFETRVTQARNTQNRVRVSDFAAQDATQERLRRELAISGIAYVYKPSDETFLSEASSVKLEDAALALAALSSNLEDVFQIRSNPGQLTDPSSATYKRLFTESLTGMNLYRYIIVFQFLKRLADENERFSATSKEKGFYKNLRFMVMHFIRRKYHVIIERPDWQLSADDQTALSRAFNELSIKILEIASAYAKEADQGYLAISRTLTSFKQLVNRIQTALSSSLPTPE